MAEALRSMVESPSIEVIPATLSDHPATRAWRTVGSEILEPERIELVKAKKKSMVYRLVGRAAEGSVVAKRCCLATGLVEKMVQEEFLRSLGMPMLRFYGLAEDPDGQHCWLFMEEATGQAYSPLNPEHRAAAGRWLATIHAGQCEPGLASRLPSQQPAHYLERLQTSRDALVRLLAEVVLPSGDVDAMQAIISHYDLLETHWGELEEVCEAAPPAVVHGDFVIKNVRVRSTPSGPALLVFDWELSGWGTPAADLAQFTGGMVSPDLAAYRSARTAAGCLLNAQDLERLSACGEFFRLIDEVAWETSASFQGYKTYRYLVRALSCLRVYEPRLAAALRRIGWSS